MKADRKSQKLFLVKLAEKISRVSSPMKFFNILMLDGTVSINSVLSCVCLPTIFM